MKAAKLLFFFLLLNTFTYAQPPEGRLIAISGVVMDQATLGAVRNVSCTNYNYNTTTDAMGRFSMNVYGGDTIHFSHIGYQPFDLVIPDTLSQSEYIVAVTMVEDTMQLAEVIVVHRVGRDRTIMRTNIRNNMAGTVRDAFSPTPAMTASQNQRRVLDEFAASTNKGHVEVGLGVGTESWYAYKALRVSRNQRNQVPPLLSTEEINIMKLLFEPRKISDYTD